MEYPSGTIKNLDEIIDKMWGDFYQWSVERGLTDLTLEEYKQSFEVENIEEAIEKLKRIHETLITVNDITVNNEEYVPSGETEVNFYFSDFHGNPFSPYSYLRTSGAKKLRKELNEPKNM